MSKKPLIPYGLNPSELTPGAHRTLTSDKLKLFTKGSLSIDFQKQKEKEKMKARKSQEDAAKVYKEFVDSFSVQQNSNDKMKQSFVTSSKEKSQEYRPQPKIKIFEKPKSTVASCFSEPEPINQDADVSSPRPSLLKSKLKKKRNRNIDTFLDELKKSQEIRATQSISNSALPKKHDFSFSTKSTHVNKIQGQIPLNLPIQSAKIQVVIPTDPKTKIIDLVAKYVSADGYQIEQIIMAKEHMNSEFSFLYDVQSDDHIYYRWRVYSLSQGDSLDMWRISPFQMIENGPFWIPPPVPVSSHVTVTEKEKKIKKTSKPKEEKVKEKTRFLNKKNRDLWETILRKLTIEREDIKKAMVFALDHAEESQEVIQTLSESLTILETSIPKKIARLFLTSDILHNSIAAVRNASSYRSEIQKHLPSIFQSLHEKYVNPDIGRLTASSLKENVLTVLRVWQAWSVFPSYFLENLEKEFLGNKEIGGDEDMDGLPLESTETNIDDIDGVEIELADNEDDIDGIPIDVS